MAEWENRLRRLGRKIQGESQEVGEAVDQRLEPLRGQPRLAAPSQQAEVGRAVSPDYDVNYDLANAMAERRAQQGGNLTAEDMQYFQALKQRLMKR